MKRDALAQFFTPLPVVEFVFDALAVLGLRGGRLRVADPACGEGVFLQEAARRLPEAELWGCDIDEALRPAWQAAGLVEPRAHMAVQDGLVDAPLFGLGAGTFDLVVGNPPYGLGVAHRARGERIESRFVRRFVALVRPGAWVAAVVPEGIVANAQSQRLRDWLLGRVAVRAVVALPEATFASAGTRARTVLVLGRKGAGEGEETLLASPRDGADVGSYLGDVLRTIGGRA